MSNEKFLDSEILRTQLNEYIRKYCLKHQVTEEEAKKHLMIKIAEQYYRGKS